MYTRVTLVAEESSQVPIEMGRDFESFYLDQYASIVRLAFTLTGRRDVAEEIAQDAFISCHGRWAKVSQFDSPAAWVRRVTVNRCVSSGRRHLTELRLISRLNYERPPQPTLAESSTRLWELVRQLPKRQAQVVALTFADDLDVASVAEILGIGEESVRTHLRRGRAALEAKLQEVDIHE